MKLTDITNDSDNLIKERIEYIFATFQKEFSNICYDERSSIVGIGEPNKQLLCYFKKTVEGEILVKFKASDKPIQLIENIENINIYISETIKMFKGNDFTRRSKNFKNDNVYKRKRENDFEYEEVDGLIAEMVLTKGDVIIGDTVSNRLTNALYRVGIKTISDLNGWTCSKLMRVKNFGENCLEELIYLFTNLKQEDSPNEDNNIDINYLHIKATSGMVRTFEQKENVSKYLCSINFDETCFEEGSLGWALCLKKQIKNDINKISYCNSTNELRELYLRNKENYEQLFDATKQFLTSLINKVSKSTRYAEMTSSLLSFDSDGQSLRGVGREYDVTGERVRQIFNKILRKAKASLNLNKTIGFNLRDFDDYLSNFSNVPIDCFALYLKLEKKEYIYRFVIGIVSCVEFLSGIEQRIDEAIPLVNKKEQKLEITLSTYEVIEKIIKGCEEICKVNYFGISIITRFLKGDNDKKIIYHKLNKLNYYGALKNVRRTDIIKIINFLLEKKVLYRTKTMRPVIKFSLDTTFEEINNLDLCQLGEIKAIGTTNLEHETVENPKKETNEVKTQIQVVDEGMTIVVEGWEVYIDEDGELLTDIKLLKRLQVLRKKIGDEKEIPYYCVAWDRVLVQLATKKPTTREEFLSIKGIRDRWFDNNGQAFMKEIREYVENK